MCIRGIHCLLGYPLRASHTRRGATAPPTKNQLTLLYSPFVPNILWGPTNPHMTDASKNMRSIRQVHGLSGGNNEVSQRWGNLSMSHHAIMVYTKTATRSRHYRFTIYSFKRSMFFRIVNRELTCAMNID